MSSIPPPRPGYRRDPDPEGRWEGVEPDEFERVEQVNYLGGWEINWPAVLLTGILLTPLVPINILLWRWAI